MLDRKEITFSEFCQKYLEYSAANHAQSTHYDYGNTIARDLIPQFGKMLLREITVQSIEDFKRSAAARCRPASVNKMLRYLKAILNKAVEWEYLDSNPCRRIKPFRLEEKTGRYLESQEIERVLAVAGSVRLIILAALHTGLRRSELFHLRWQDVDFEEKIITVRNRPDWHSKNYKNRVIPMTDVLTEELFQHYLNRAAQSWYVFPGKNSRPMNNIDKSLKRIWREADVARFTLHDLRRTYASHLAFEAADITSIQELLGHRHVSTTMQYTRTAQERLRLAVARLTYGQTESRVPNMAHSGKSRTSPAPVSVSKSMGINKEKMAPPRIELGTHGFSVRCSTN